MSSIKNNTSSPLWYIAILPSEQILLEIKSFKEYARDHFDSSRALRSPAHITLIPPFRFSTKRLPELESVLQNFARQQTSFEVELNGFSCFAPRVIYVDVSPNEKLEALQQTLKAEMINKFQLPFSDKQGFHPHVTVAFRDLSKEQFRSAWNYFSSQKYHRLFSATAITLLKHHGKGWAVYKVSLLSKESRDR